MKELLEKLIVIYKTCIDEIEKENPKRKLEVLKICKRYHTEYGICLVLDYLYDNKIKDDDFFYLYKRIERDCGENSYLYCSPTTYYHKRITGTIKQMIEALKFRLDYLTNLSKEYDKP